jgi:zinc transporter ZupT
MNLATEQYDHHPFLEENQTPKDEKTLLIIKIAFIFVIFGIALGFGILPAKVKSCGRNPRFMSMANSFSGGLFLAIALIHILPDVINDYHNHLHPEPEPVTYITNKSGRRLREEPKADFPLPFMLVFCGYTFILLVDKVMFDSHALFGGHDHGNGHGEEKEEHGHGHDNEKKKGHEHGLEHGKKHGHGKKSEGQKHDHKEDHTHDYRSEGHEHEHDH